MANCNKLVGHTWEILSSTWYHRWLQLVTPTRQNAQKRSRKFCRSKEGKNSETHPIQPEKGETGCVLGAGEGSSGWRRMWADSPTREMHTDGLVVAATAEGLASVSYETLLARAPPKGGPVSPLLAKNVPPARFLNARTLPGSSPSTL